MHGGILKRYNEEFNMNFFISLSKSFLKNHCAYYYKMSGENENQ